jgi:hypothetical protein
MLSRHSAAPWLRGAMLGALLGTLFLGIGGRAAMRAIGSLQGAPPGFSIGGTTTVVFLGAASGLAAGLIYVTCRRLLQRHQWWARGLFAVILLGVTLRGLRPVDSQRLIIFLPLFVAFGFALDRVWEGRQRRHQSVSEGLS